MGHTALLYEITEAGSLHGQFAEQWRARAGDAEFEEVRRAAQMIDAEYRESTPWWGRCDLDDAHIFRAADGRPVLIDVFCMAGTELYRAILEDVAGVHRRIPRERMRYALERGRPVADGAAEGVKIISSAPGRCECRGPGPRTRRFRVLAGCPVVPRPRSHRWTGRRREGGPGKIRLGPPVAGLARRITLS